jgi:hypothetical protein
MEMYNLLGEKIRTLINQNLKPGRYEVDWNASEYPSGVYFYTLSHGDITQTKKMMLVK